MHTWTQPCIKREGGGTTNEWGRSGMREREKKEEGYCHISVFCKGQRVGKMTKEFPAALFLLSNSFFTFCSLSSFPNFSVSLSVIFPFSLSCIFLSLLLWLSFLSASIALFFILALLCLLMTCVSLAVFPFGYGIGRKPWFLHTLSFSVLTKHWLFMTANSLIISASVPVLPPDSPFHAFSTSSLLLRLLSTLSPPFTLGGSSSCLRTDCLVAAGFWRVNKALVSLVGQGESQLSICNHNVLVLPVSEGWSYKPLGKDLQIDFVVLVVERCCLRCFLSTFP